LLARAFGYQQRGVEWGDSSIPTNGQLSDLAGLGVPVTEMTAMRIAAAWASVRILATTLAGLPLYAVRDTGTIKRRLPVQPTVIADPFGAHRMTRRDGFTRLMVSLLLRGNGYAFVTDRNPVDLRPRGLLPLHPDTVRPHQDSSGFIDHYRINGKTVDAADVLHLVGMAAPGAVTGMSVIEYARTTFGLALATEQFGTNFFVNGAHMSGVIEMDADLDNDRARQLRDRFTTKHAGLRRSHLPGVLTGGAKWKQISVNPDDAQFLETRDFQRGEIAMLFGVPPHMLGMTDKTTSWGTGLVEQSLGFLRYTVSDWVGRFEDAWTAMLPGGATGTLARFDLDAMLRPDPLKRWQAHTAARNAAIKTVNEIRAEETLEPVDGGDDIHAPLNSAHAGTPQAEGGQGGTPAHEGQGQ
jgi:HK97 family phage portal protein